MIRNIICILISSFFLVNVATADLAASLRLSARPFGCTAYSELLVAGATADSFSVDWVIYKDGLFFGEDNRLGGSGKSFTTYKDCVSDTYYGYWVVDSYNWAYVDSDYLGKVCHESVWY